MADDIVEQKTDAQKAQETAAERWNNSLARPAVGSSTPRGEVPDAFKGPLNPPKVIATLQSDSRKK